MVQALPVEAADVSAVGSTSHSDTIRAKIGIVVGAASTPFELPSPAPSARADARAESPSRVREEKNAAVFVGVGAESRCRGGGVVDGCGPTGISGPCAGEVNSGEGVRTGRDVDALVPSGSGRGAKDDTEVAGAAVVGVEVLTAGTPLVPGVRRCNPEGAVVVGMDCGVIGANVSVRSVLLLGVRRGRSAKLLVAGCGGANSVGTGCDQDGSDGAGGGVRSSVGTGPVRGVRISGPREESSIDVGRSTVAVMPLCVDDVAVGRRRTEML